MKKKVLLLTAPRPELGYSPVHYGDNRPPQGLGYLAAYISKFGHKADIIDLYAFGGGGDVLNNPFVNQEELGEQLNIDIESAVEEFKPDYIGMYVHTMSFESACELSSSLKKRFPYVKQICGGPHPSIKAESIPASFDHVVIGEGEIALLEIIEGRATDRIITGARVSSSELEQLPWPNFDLFWGKPYNWGLKLFNQNISPVLTISTSRGCPFRCRFCGVKNLYPVYTVVSAKHVFDRMVYLSEKYAVNTFYFREDNFTAHLGRLAEFCDLIAGSGNNFRWVCESRVKELTLELIEKMARAGCLGLYIGCESGSPKVLENMCKEETREDYLEKFPIIHEHGIATYTTWVYGTPDETQEDRRTTDELIDLLKPVVADRFVYIGIPRSSFYDQIVNNGNYEFLDKNGFLYPDGYLSLSTSLYGEEDPRVQYVKKMYEMNDVKPVDVEW